MIENTIQNGYQLAAVIAAFLIGLAAIIWAVSTRIKITGNFTDEEKKAMIRILRDSE